MKLKALNWRGVAILTLVGIFLCAGITMAAGLTNQTSSLNGTVVADGFVAAGSMVTEGQVLVKVKTIAGNAPAVRANTSGKLVNVTIAPGSNISAGQVVAQIAN